MQVIVSNINPFTIEQSVYIVNDDGSAKELPSVELEHLAGAIASYAHVDNISRVHLFGIEEFVKPLVDKIQEQHTYFFGYEGPLSIKIN